MILEGINKSNIVNYNIKPVLDRISSPDEE